MDKQTSALLASWLGVGLGVVTLVVASIAMVASTVALLSVGQVQRLACRQFTLSCNFEGVDARFLVVDSVRSKAPPNPYAYASDMEPWTHKDDTSWDLLVPQTGIGTALSGYTSTKPVCVAASAIVPLLEHGTAHFQGADWGWAVNFADPPIGSDTPNKPVGLSPKRTIGFEFDATYGALHRPVDVTLHLKVFKGNKASPYRSIIATAEEDYAIALPQDSLGVMMVCPLPRLTPGPYQVTLQTHGKEGDWEQTIAPIDLEIVDTSAASTPPPPKGP